MIKTKSQYTLKIKSKVRDCIRVWTSRSYDESIKAVIYYIRGSLQEKPILDTYPTKYKRPF